MLKDKVVVVTGASSGIGALVAERVGQGGGKPILAARREPELSQVAARCGKDALVVAADVTRRADVQRILDAALQRFGDVDVWVNNAGRGITRPVALVSDEDFDEMMRVNVKSALYGMQVVLPHFQQRKRGHIINVSSMLGRIPFASGRAAYSAAKHALNSLTANLRMDLRAEFPEIRVSVVFPGVVATDFGLKALGGGPDSRSLPFVQPASEVADVIIDVIEHPRAEAYTRPGLREQVAAYYAVEDRDAAEATMPRVPGR